MMATDSAFELADNEKTIRVYETTALSRWFWAKPVIGYITVTNKRVLYHSEAKSATGGSKLVSEIPLDDVSGVSTWVGSSINFWGFIIFSLLMYLAMFALDYFFRGLVGNWPLGLILATPYVIYWLFEREILSAEAREQILENLKPVTNLSLLENKDTFFYKRVFEILFLVSLVIIAVNMAYRVFSGVGALFVLLIVFFFIYRLLFGDLRTFSLSISAKSAKGSGISISGGGLLSIFGVDTIAAKSLLAGPAADSELVAHELGALILDIQQLGDMAVNKWQA